MKRLDIGHGTPVLLLHGFGLSPLSYRSSAERLASRGGVRVIVPNLFDTSTQWTPESALVELVGLLDELGLGRVSAIGHSFGGCFELGLAATCPERLIELVFCDTLGVSNGWGLAKQALRPANFFLLATVGAALDFARTSLTHPAEIAQAAWHGFRGDHHPDVASVAHTGLPSHVLWAERDTLLHQDEGRQFAEELGASFTVVSPRPGGKTVDHNWMYRCPELLVDQIEGLGLEALTQRPERVETVTRAQ